MPRKTIWFLGMLGTAAALGVPVSTPQAVAAPDGVDRKRLTAVVEVPSVGDDWWYFDPMLDGRVLEGGEEPGRVSLADLREELANDDSDAERWMDLVSVARSAKDETTAADASKKAVSIFRRRSEASPGDGRALASLGLALFAAGDEKAGQDAIHDASHAARFAWAGVAAKADVAVLREASRVANARFATLEESMHWWKEVSDVAKKMDAEALDFASKFYDEAVSAIEAEGAIGQVAASVYERRLVLHRVRRRTDANVRHWDDWETAEGRKAAGMQPSEPFSVLLNSLDDAMSAPDKDGGRHVEAFGALSSAARANVLCDLARFREMADSPDATKAARALQSAACLQWFCLRDADMTVATLRRAIAKDPRVRQSWIALAMVLAETGRTSDLVDACRDRAKSIPTPRNRLLFAQALWKDGRTNDAETEWLAAQAADPKDALADLGAAAVVVHLRDDEKTIGDARAFVRAARDATSAADLRSEAAMCRLYEAALAGLAGEIDAAEKEARSLVADYPTWDAPKEILAAINRRTK